MRVAARIFHPEPAPNAGPLSAWLDVAKADLAQRHAAAFAAAGADTRIVTGRVGDQSFGARLREIVAGLRGFDGLVLMGSGALALAAAPDLARFVTAAGEPGAALANNRYSADIVAVGGLAPLASLPDLQSDNALPRWLEEVHGYRVADLRRQWRLGVDLDSPLDVLLVDLGHSRGGAPTPAGVAPGVLRQALDGVRAIVADPRAEVLIAGRTSPRSLAWLEGRAACRVRALVEERGLRAGGDGAWAGTDGGRDAIGNRGPASVLGALLDHDGPAALGRILGGLADTALVDTRVLLAHRLGRDERDWPPPEDRFASDLLLPDRIEDPWLRQLTAAALDAPIPVLLGGHTLVGPGLRLALAPERALRRRTAIAGAGRVTGS